MARPPPAGAPSPLGSLEWGRFLAASLVVLNHTVEMMRPFSASPSRQLLGGYDPQGLIGVEYFFVLSGFVMLVAHRRDFGRLAAIPRFVWRRLWRIYPVYWLALSLPAILLHRYWRWHDMIGMASLTGPYAAHLVPPAWSLQYELAFYAVFAVALAPFVGRWLLGLWAMLVIWLLLPMRWEYATLFGATHPVRHFLLHHTGILMSPFNVLFIAGLLAASIHRRLRLGGVAGAAAGVVLSGLGVAALAALAPSLSWYNAYPVGLAHIPLALGFAGLLLGLASLERAGVLRCGRRARWLGALSYPLYILHVPLLTALQSQCAGWLRLPLPGLYILAAAALAVIYAVAALVTWLVDQPLQRLARRYR